MNAALLDSYVEMLRDGCITAPGVDPIRFTAAALAREAVRCADLAEAMDTDPRKMDPTGYTAGLATVFGAVLLAASQIGISPEQLLRTHVTGLELMDPSRYSSARLVEG